MKPEDDFIHEVPRTSAVIAVSRRHQDTTGVKGRQPKATGTVESDRRLVAVGEAGEGERELKKGTKRIPPFSRNDVSSRWEKTWKFCSLSFPMST